MRLSDHQFLTALGEAINQHLEKAGYPPADFRNPGFVEGWGTNETMGDDAGAEPYIEIALATGATVRFRFEVE